MKVTVVICPATKQIHLQGRPIAPGGVYGFGLCATDNEEETKQLVKDWLKAHKEWDVLCY